MAADDACCLLPALTRSGRGLSPRSARSRWTLRRLRNPRMQACKQMHEISGTMTNIMQSETHMLGQWKLAWMYDDAP